MSRLYPIAVSQRVDRVIERSETRDALDHRVLHWVRELGAVGVPVPNALGEDLKCWLDSVRPTAIILSGGNDIGTSAERDLTEVGLLNHAATFSLPVLGICRGMQMLAHYAGGQLIPLSGHCGSRHVLKAGRGESSFHLSEVNSFHNFGLASCPPGYETLAYAEDGSIEAMRHYVLGWEGWMWHPEREQNFSDSHILRARNLLIDGGGG